jgi:hypothetical protein
MGNKLIPIAEEFLQQSNVVGMTDLMIPLMIEFAKLHVEQALKEASDNAEADYTYEGFGGEFYDQPIYRYFVKKDSILNSYPLENIK